jgi:hypothetical protein
MYFCYNYEVPCMRKSLESFFLESHHTTRNPKSVEYVLHNKFQEERMATAFRRRSFRQATINVVISVTPHGTTWLLLDTSRETYRRF